MTYKDCIIDCMGDTKAKELSDGESRNLPTRCWMSLKDMMMEIFLFLFRECM